MTSADVATLAPGTVKICGLRTPKHAGAAALAGADLIGFVFAPARRQVAPEEAAACIKAARLAAGCRQVFAVGVFVNESADTINAIAERAGLDVLQLHGDEDARLVDGLRRPVVKALRLPPGTTLREAEETITRFQVASKPPIAYLIDGYDAQHYGGQGVRTDWNFAEGLARRYPVLLAGGLDETNVAQAIGMVRPLGVDVSSGVETDGIKDIAKITVFVREAKSSYRGLVAFD